MALRQDWLSPLTRISKLAFVFIVLTYALAKFGWVCFWIFWIFLFIDWPHNWRTVLKSSRVPKKNTNFQKSFLSFSTPFGEARTPNIMQKHCTGRSESRVPLFPTKPTVFKKTPKMTPPRAPRGGRKLHKNHKKDHLENDLKKHTEKPLKINLS